MRTRVLVLAGLAALAVSAGGLYVATAPPAAAAASGLWRISCDYVGSAADDPIVVPGKPGRSHLHDFFGNFSTNANSTYESMKGVKSSCPKNDRAAYWVPALYRNGVKIPPERMTAYYLPSISPGEERIEPFPPGFKVVFGNKDATSASQVDGHIEWGCTGNTQIDIHDKKPPPACPSGGIQVRIQFPACWNGIDNGGNNITNLRFPSRGKCPQGFNRPLPTVRMNISYPVGTETGDIRLASGPVYSIHADLWNTWDQAALTELVKTCLNGKQQCPHFQGSSPGREPGPGAPTKTAGAAPGAAAKPSSAPGTRGAAGGGPAIAAPNSPELGAPPRLDDPAQAGDHLTTDQLAADEFGSDHLATSLVANEADPFDPSRAMIPAERPYRVSRWTIISPDGRLTARGAVAVGGVALLFLAIVAAFAIRARRGTATRQSPG